MSELNVQNTNKLRKIDYGQGKVREKSGNFALLKLWKL